MSRNPLQTAGKAHMLLGCSLHADLANVNPANASNIGAHERNVWRKFGLLRDDGGVDIGDVKARDGNFFANDAQQIKAVSVFKIIGSVREQAADVAQSGGAQQRIHDCVSQHICVGVTKKPVRVRDFASAQNELSAYDQLVRVVTMPNPHKESPLCLKIPSKMATSSGVVSFKLE